MNQISRRQVCMTGILLLTVFIWMAADSSAQQDGYDEYGMGGMNDYEDGMMGGMGMGGMGMGGMDGYEATPDPLATKIGALGQSKDDEQRQKLMAEIKSLLNQQYDDFIGQNEIELLEMEARLEGLRNQLKRRRDAKADLVDLELKRISNQAKGLAWPTGQSPPNNNDSEAMGGMMSGIMGGNGTGIVTMPDGMMGMATRRAKKAPRNKTVDEYVARKLFLDRLIEEQSKLPVRVPSNETEVEKTNNTLDRDATLTKTGLAIHNFESNAQIFPANIVAMDGTQLLSWRVLILPYLGDEEIRLFKEFHLNEPWDSEHNIKLLPRIPAYFKSVPDSDTKTSILGLESPGAMFEPNVRLGFGRITDGSSNTILCIAANDELAVEWTRPQDVSPLEFEQRGPDDLFSHDGKTNVVFCDGATKEISPEMDRENLKIMVQRNDGQTVNFEHAK